MKIAFKDYRKEILQMIRKRVDSGGGVYIYGAALRGKRVRKYLEDEGIQNLKEYVVDDEFLQEGQKEIISLSAFNRIAKFNDVLVSGFESYSRYCNFVDMGKTAPQILFPFLAFPASMNIENCYIDEAYYTLHQHDFARTYNRLSDNYSRELLSCFLEAQIGGDVKKLQQSVSKIQYFDAGIPGSIDIFIDCGGYTGDTLEEAYKYLKNIKHYYLFEPDKDNLSKVYKVISGLEDKDITVIEKGVWDEETVLKFSSDNSASRLDMNGDIAIEVTTIDNSIVVDKGQKVYIKMDIEGSEVQALKGAARIIGKMHPYMAISVYHKRDDLFVIPDIITEISGSAYNFYLKYYGDSCFCELILYCFPKERG